MIHYIYKITNLKNNKIYIGKHSSKKTNDNYYGSGVAIKRAIKKYGKENFKKEILCYCDNEKELNAKERYYINFYDTYKKGYNMTFGGEGMLGYKPSEQQKIRQSMTQKLKFMNEPEYREKLSKKAKLRTGEKNPFFGKKLPQSHIEKMRKARIKAITGKNNPSAVKVKCIELNLIFDTAKDAALFVGLKYSTSILKAAKGQRNKAGGYRWLLVD